MGLDSGEGIDSSNTRGLNERLKEHCKKPVTFLAVLRAFSTIFRCGTVVSEEENLNGNGQTGVKHNDNNQKDLRGPDVCCAKHGVEITEQKNGGNGKANTDKDEVQD